MRRLTVRILSRAAAGTAAITTILTGVRAGAMGPGDSCRALPGSVTGCSG